MTVKTFFDKHAGKTAVLTTKQPALKINVIMLAARNKFGRLDIRVSPLSGSGLAWVSDSRLAMGAKIVVDEAKRGK